MLFLVKLIPVLKNKFLIIRNMSNTKKTILFKIIVQKIILSRTRESGDNSNNQYKSNKFFDNQFNRNQQSDKVRHFNKFKKSSKSNNYFNMQTSNKRTHAKIKNKKIIVVLNIINRDTIIEIAQKKINEARQL